MRLWDRLARQTQAFDMELDRVVHLALNFCARVTGGHAARQIWRVGRETGGGILDND